MVDVTDTYFRFLVRLMTRNAVVYTEMINENAVLDDKLTHLLEFEPI